MTWFDWNIASHLYERFFTFCLKNTMVCFFKRKSINSFFLSCFFVTPRSTSQNLPGIKKGLKISGCSLTQENVYKIRVQFLSVALGNTNIQSDGAADCASNVKLLPLASRVYKRWQWKEGQALPLTSLNIFLHLKNNLKPFTEIKANTSYHQLLGQTMLNYV